MINKVKIFGMIFIIGFMSSSIPYMHIGMFLGLPSVLVNAFVLTILFSEYEKSKVTSDQKVNLKK
jgi:hypothetical protein